MAKVRKHPTHRERLRARMDQPVRKSEPVKDDTPTRRQRELRRRDNFYFDPFDPDAPENQIRFK